MVPAREGAQPPVSLGEKTKTMEEMVGKGMREELPESPDVRQT